MKRKSFVSYFFSFFWMLEVQQPYFNHKAIRSKVKNLTHENRERGKQSGSLMTSLSCCTLMTTNDTVCYFYKCRYVQSQFYFFFLYFFKFYFIFKLYNIVLVLPNIEMNPPQVYMFPILSPPPTSPPIPSLCVVPVHQPQASSIVHRTWTGDSFHT